MLFETDYKEDSMQDIQDLMDIDKAAIKDKEQE